MPVQRIQLTGNMLTRRADTDYDQAYKNCYPEMVDKDNLFVIKRPGLTEVHDFTDAAGRGIYSWEGNLYSVTGNTIRKGAATVGTINTTTGRVYYASTGGGSPLLVIHDKTDGWTVNTSGTLTEITDAQFPTNLVSGIAFLDQYIFLMDSSGKIWNSNVGDVTAWESTDFISAEMRPDAGVAISNYFNYIVGFGEDSIEFFYDAANDTGSPLSKVPEAVVNVGCAAGDTVVQVDNNLLFVGKDRAGGKAVYKFEGLTPKKVSNKPIERLLNAEVDMSDAYAYPVRVNGHLFYVLTLPTTAKTVVYDMVDNAWHEWTSYNGATETYFTGMDHATLDGVCYIQDEDNGKVYKMDCAVYQDDGNTIKVEGTTDLFDGNTNQNKFMTRLEVIGDITSSTSALGISWSDDDYNTFSTVRSVDLSGRAILTRLGSFQRRAFRYTFDSNLPMRLEALEVDVDLGGYGE